MPQDLSSIRLRRLNNLMLALASGDPASKQRLMRDLEYTQSRTFERDISFLRDEYAAEIAFDRKKKGYLLKGKGRFLLTLDLSERDVTALSAGLRMAAHFLPHLEKDCGRLWNTLRTAIPETLAQQGDAIGKCAVVTLPVSPVDPGIFETITGAITKKRMLRIAYNAPGRAAEAPHEHTLSPWGVYFRAHAWYLWALNERFDAPSPFRIGRVTGAEVLDRPWHADPPADTCVETYASSAWYGMPGPATIPVRIRVRSPLATAVSETTWHPTQRITWDDDGCALTLEAVVPNLDDVARWILASAPSAEAVEPVELRELVRKWAREAGGDDRV